MRTVICFGIDEIESQYKITGNKPVAALYEIIYRTKYENIDVNNITCYAWKKVDDMGFFEFHCGPRNSKVNIKHLLHLKEYNYNIDISADVEI